MYTLATNLINLLLSILCQQPPEEQEQNSVKPCIFSDIPSRVSQNVRNVHPAQPAEDPEEVTLCQRAPGVSGSSAAHIREVPESEKG